MPADYNTPGVYRKEIFIRPETPFQTGVPAFVGFADAAETADGSAPARQPVKLFRKEEFAAKFKTPDDGYLAEAVKGFFGNGGTSCYVVPADTVTTKKEEALTNAIDSLASVDDFDLLAVPDAGLLSPRTNPNPSAVQRVQQHVLAHCAEHNDRFAVLDALPERTTETVLTQRDALTFGQSDLVNGALYYPWIQVYDQTTQGLRSIPPCGHVAGVYARTDALVGVFKAPANEELLGAINLETNIDNRAQDELNPKGVNCIRAFAGRGIRVWGARTLSRDALWRYVNVRRQFLTINRWVELNMTWASFEPNAARLWVRISRELGDYLETLWREGALKGGTRDEAFYVKCDEETNPAETREVGRVVTEVGLALVAPAEFVVVRIFHRAGVTTVG